MIPLTPRGFRDVLPEEACWRESITTKVQAVLSSWGYAPIETPTLELLEVLEQGGVQLGGSSAAFAPIPAPTSTPISTSASTSTPTPTYTSAPAMGGASSFRLFDSDGALLVLRPDVTLPIARMVASRLGHVVNPLRFRYVQPVFREEDSLRGQAREFTQIGIESIGISGAVADSEVILLLVDALKACGLERFTIAICTVGVLRDLLSIVVDEGDASEQWRSAVLAACHQNNAVEVARLAKDARVDKRYGRALKELLSLRGGAEAIERCRALVEPLGCVDGLDVLAQTYNIIESVGAAPFVTVDFSVMSAFDYYTGLVFEAYAPGLGVTLGSGGRYDHMLAAYGTRAPAAGFAFNLERVMAALLKQGVTANASDSRAEAIRVFFNGDNPASAFLEAARLRERGSTAVLAPAGEETDGDEEIALVSPLNEEVIR